MQDIVVPGDEEKLIQMGKRLGFDRIFLCGSDAIICAPSEVGKYKSKITICESCPDDRKTAEVFKPRIILDPREMDQVTAKICKKNDVYLGFSIARLLAEKNISNVLSKMGKTIRIARKYKVGTVIASFARKPLQMRAPRDIISLFSTIGMRPEEAKKSLNANFFK